MRKLITTAVLTIVAVGGGLSLTASPAAADCLTYTQFELAHTDVNNDGKNEVTAYYPPVVSDVNPVDCLTSGPGALPRVVKVG